MFERTHRDQYHLRHTLIAACYEWFEAFSNKVTLSPGESISRVRGDVLYVIEGLISGTVTSSQADSGVVLELVGAGGMVGTRGLLRMDTAETPVLYRAEETSTVYLVDRQIARLISKVSPDTRLILERYNAMILNEHAQWFGASLTRSAMERVALYLLYSDYGIDGLGTLTVTNERIAEALCMRRPTVGEHLTRLADLGVIERERGMIRCVDVRALSEQTNGLWDDILLERDGFDDWLAEECRRLTSHETVASVIAELQEKSVFS